MSVQKCGRTGLGTTSKAGPLQNRPRAFIFPLFPSKPAVPPHPLPNSNPVLRSLTFLAAPEELRMLHK